MEKARAVRQTAAGLHRATAEKYNYISPLYAVALSGKEQTPASLKLMLHVA